MPKDLKLNTYPFLFAAKHICNQSLRKLTSITQVEDINNLSYVYGIDSFDFVAFQENKQYLELEMMAISQSYRLLMLDNLSYLERISHVRSLISSLFNKLIALDLDAVVFGGNPHSLSDFIFARLCNILNIRSISFQDFPIAPLRSFLFDSLQKSLRPSELRNLRDQQHVNSLSLKIASKFKKDGRLYTGNDEGYSKNNENSVKTFYSNQSKGMSLLEQVHNANLSEEDRLNSIQYMELLHSISKPILSDKSIIVFLLLSLGCKSRGQLILTQLELLGNLACQHQNYSDIYKRHPAMFIDPNKK